MAVHDCPERNPDNALRLEPFRGARLVRSPVIHNLHRFLEDVAGGPLQPVDNRCMCGAHQRYNSGGSLSTIFSTDGEDDSEPLASQRNKHTIVRAM